MELDTRSGDATGPGTDATTTKPGTRGAKRAVLALASAAVTATVLIPLGGGTAQAATTACDSTLVAPQGSLIGKLWRDNGGQNSVYGCPTTKEFGYPTKRGSWQRFRNGMIVWSPNLGDGNLVRVFTKNNTIWIKWGVTSDTWDKFNIRWSKNGGRASQLEVRGLTSRTGQFNLAPYGNTTTNGDTVDKWVFIVQGCKSQLFGSDCSSWTIPISITTRN